LFFSASTHRWSILVSCLKNSPVVKSLSDTRWEANARATAAVKEGYSGIIDALQNLSEDKQQKGETRREAENIAEKMQELEFAFLLELWNDILERWQMTSKGLQDGKISIAVCGSLLETLATFVEDLKDKFDTYEAKAKETIARS
jgi:tRNA A37 threonylcarbamoyltransferase TsaD